MKKIKPTLEQIISANEYVLSELERQQKKKCGYTGICYEIRVWCKHNQFIWIHESSFNPRPWWSYITAIFHHHYWWALNERGQANRVRFVRRRVERLHKKLNKNIWLYYK